MIDSRRSRIWTRILVLASATLLAACNGDSVRHPLDDSETKPADIETAVQQAESVMDDVTAAVLDGAAHDDRNWSADSDCATNADSPEQGDVSRILYRSFPEATTGTSAAEILTATEAHWESAGHTVGPGAANMPNQAITRIDGISYSMVEAESGVELRAFLPCF